MNKIDTQRFPDNFASQLRDFEHDRLIDKFAQEELDRPRVTIAVGYIRVSTKGQAAEDKVSLREQKQDIEDYCAKMRWELRSIYEDAGISGTHIEGRDAFNQMLADANNHKFDVIVGWTSDRLARNVVEMMNTRENLKTANVQITTVKEPTEIVDPRLFQFEKNSGFKKMPELIYAVKAEADNVSRTQRFDMGKRGCAKDGKIPCRAPYGYRRYSTYNSQIKRKEYHVDVVEIEEKTIVFIFDKYDKESIGIRKIAETLNEMQIKAPSGGTWNYSSVKYVLQNPTYVGLVRWGWRLSESKKSIARLQAGHEGLLTEGVHKSIIDHDLFMRVQTKLASRKKLGGRAVASKRGLLVGIAKCGRCGGGTFITKFPHWLAYKKPRAEREKYKPSEMYMCSSYSSRGKSGCSKRWVMYKDKLEKIVISKVKSLANSQATRKAYLGEITKDNSDLIKKEIATLEASMGELQATRLRIKQAYGKGVIQLEEYSHDLAEIDKDAQKIRNQIEEKTTQIHELSDKNKSYMKISTLLGNFDQSWNNASMELKKELMQSILEKVVVNENKVQIVFRTA